MPSTKGEQARGGDNILTGLLFAAGLVGATFCLRAGLGLYAGDPPLLILFVVPILVGAYLGGGKTGLARRMCPAV